MLTTTPIFWKNFSRNTSKIKGMSTPDQTPPFTGTSIDFGEDLLDGKTIVRNIPAEPHAEPLTPEGIEDQLQSAHILVNEGMVEEAKKVLRKILISDAHNVPARKRLEEIHELELKQILGEFEPAGKLGAEERRRLLVDPSEIMRQLESDLGSPTEEMELSLFHDAAAVDQFAGDLDRKYANAPERERMDLGIAFLEMGFYHLAVRQFQAACRRNFLQNAQDSPEEYETLLGAQALLAYTLILAGKPFEAIIGMEPLVGDSEIHDDHKIHFYYLLGRANEAIPKHQAALEWYNQVRKVDPRYRDVGERIYRLHRAKK